MDRKATDEVAWNEELDRLFADCGFLQYHAEYVKRREFNAFDVLRYAEYEIRHSNVIAWLLDPGETHGIDRRFLEWFLDQGRLPGKMPPEIVRGDGVQTVRVERELHFVDVTIFLESDRGRHIVAIENKPSRASPEHYEQVRGYDAVLREKYRGRAIHSVLLSTSREGIEAEDKIAHVSWREVGAQIRTMIDEGAFGERNVAAFIRQYLVAVGRLIGPEGSDADYFRKLLDDHHSLLMHMSGAIGEERGEHKVREMVPDGHAHYRETVVRLVKDFRQEPGRLRDEVRDLLTGRGIGTTIHGPWLNWELEAAPALGIPWCIRWVLDFQYRQISVWLEVPSHCRNKEAVKDLLAFVRERPIDRRRRERYPMRADGYGYYHVFNHELVADEILSGKSTEVVTEAVLHTVTEFLDAEDSDYTRINDYFQCLAFRPASAVPTEVAAEPVAEEAK